MTPTIEQIRALERRMAEAQGALADERARLIAARVEASTAAAVATELGVTRAAIYAALARLRRKRKTPA